MEPYPRSKTWPYLAVVIVLFLLALWRPNWWATGRGYRLSWRASDADFETRSVASRTEERDRVSVDFRPRWLNEPSVPLEPPVSERRVLATPRIAVEPVFDGELNRPAGRTSADSTGQTVGRSALTAEPLPELAPESEPVITPGSQATAGNRLDLELPASDLAEIDSLSRARDAAVMRAPIDEPVIFHNPPQAWPYPTGLRRDLDQLISTNAQMASWTHDVASALDELQALATHDDPAVKPILERLERLAAESERLETFVATADHTRLRRIRYAMERRCVAWRQVARLAAEQYEAPMYVNVLDALPILQQVRDRINRHPSAEAWSNFLMLDRLTQIATENWVTDPTIRRDAARTVVRRFAANDFTTEQRSVINDRAIRDLEGELRVWAEQPIDLQYLLTTIERFEEGRSDACARQVVAQLEALRYSRQPSAAGLAEAINAHYRNANVRISVSGSLLNSLLPVVEPIEQQIRDKVLGADVVGQNQTWTDLRVQLITDDQRLHLRLSADGQSRTRSVSSKGPVRFFSRGQSQFRADKELLVSAQGVYVTRATATAQSGDPKVLNIETDFDEIPLLGWIVRQIALDEHRSQRGQVRLEIQNRIKRQATRQLDQSVQERLTGAEEKLDDKVIHPLRRLELDPTAIEMKTTEDRLVMRFRLASPEQLAAYTPRPRALANNLLSLQMHESAANNLLEQLDLEDERVELEQLVTELATKLKIDPQDIHDEIPTGVTVRLASERPIQFEFNEDRVTVIVRIQELKTPKRTWHNFVARGRYRADVSQTHVDLHRDGGIELLSEQIGFRDQVALRGIFTKVLARNHRLNILHGRIKSNAQLHQLGITQFVARDGWIAICVGPQSQDRIASESTDPPH